MESLELLKYVGLVTDKHSIEIQITIHQSTIEKNDKGKAEKLINDVIWESLLCSSNEILNNIILSADVETNLIKCSQTFIQNEEFHNKKRIPYRRV